MFKYDAPIEKSEDDLLDRIPFTKHFGEALLSWDEKESLVIALCGEWGVGKTSIINLTKEYINNLKTKKKPTIISFNPWLVSGQNRLIEHFFGEISKELKLRNDSKDDEKTATLLELYASVLSLTPPETTIDNLRSKLIIGIGLLGLTANQIIDWIGLSNDTVKIISIVGGSLLILSQIASSIFFKMSNIFRLKSKLNQKSIFEIKNDIKAHILDRNKKILIVIDDLDRLSAKEVKEIFKLIKINADFPNMVYLIPYSQKVIERKLNENDDISAKDYLSKIIQVNFDTPLIMPNQIYQILFKELDRLIIKLPASAKNYFNEEDPYWGNIFNSGLNMLFTNIRDIKRFISSLEFNISLINQKNVLEVNPVDFIAIEAIRVFLPEFYLFLKENKVLFTSTNTKQTGGGENIRKTELEKGFALVPENLKKPIINLCKILFPQVKDIYQHGYSTYGNEWQSEWSKKLRFCSSSNFDSYFNLTPGGSKDNLSQYELQILFNSTNSLSELETILRSHIQNGKIRIVLRELSKYTNEEILKRKEVQYNIIQALFNISDNLPQNRQGMLDFGADSELQTLVFQILKDNDKETNKQLLENTIKNSTSIFGPISRTAHNIRRNRENKDQYLTEIIEPSELENQKTLCLNKIIENKNKLLDNPNLLTILYIWKDWDLSSNFNNYIKDVLENNDQILKFLRKFFYTWYGENIGDYVSTKKQKFNYKDLFNFVSKDIIIEKIQSIKKDSVLYSKNQEIIDLFLLNVSDWDITED